MTESQASDDLGRPDMTLPKENQTPDAQNDWDHKEGYVSGEGGQNEGGAQRQSSGAYEGTVANAPTDDADPKGKSKSSKDNKDASKAAPAPAKE